MSSDTGIGRRRLKAVLRIALVILGVSSGLVSGASGATNSETETGSQTGAPPTSASSGGGTTADCTVENSAKITGVYEKDATKKDVQLGDTIVLKMQCLASFLKGQSNPKKTIVLFIDGRPLVKLPAYPPVDPQKDELHFELRRNEADREVWSYVLGDPVFKGLTREIKVSAGYSDQFELPAEKNTLTLHTMPKIPLAIWLTVLAFLLVLFFWVGKSSNLLRDQVPDPLITGQRRPFSLARVQAAWWLFLILGCWLFIGIITGDYSTSITGTTVILFSFAGATVATATVIDVTKSSQRDTPLHEGINTLRENITSLNEKILAKQSALAQANASAPPDPGKVAALNNDVLVLTTQLNDANSDLTKLKNRLAAKPDKAVDFLTDILSDAEGVTFQRFQVFAWAITLGIVFLWEVQRNLAMPNFGDTLLALLGISSGTYLGLKLPEPTPKK